MANLVRSSGIGNENSILAMQRGNFSFKKELKSLFFYEESSTWLDQLRQIVHKYELKTSELTVAYNSTEKPNNANIKNHSHAFSLRSFNELPPS